MSAGEVRNSRAFIEFGVKYDEVMSGLNAMKKEAQKFSRDMGGLSKAGGALKELGPAAASVAGPLGGVVGSLTSLLALNPATWAVAAATALYAYCDSVLQADIANRKALESGDRLALLYGKDIADMGMDAGVKMHMDRRTQQLVDEQGAEGASKTIKKELGDLRAEYAQLERAAKDFGWTQEEVNKMAKGEVEVSMWQSLKDRAKSGLKYTPVGQEAKMAAEAWDPKLATQLNNNFTEDLHGRQSALQAVAAQIKAAEEAQKQLNQAEKKNAGDSMKERKKAAEDMAAALKKAADANAATVAAREAVEADKASAKQIQADPAAAVKKALAVEEQARADEARAIEKINALRYEAIDLEGRKGNLTKDEGERLAALKKEVETIIAAREKATKEIERAVRLGEQAAQAVKKEADEAAKLAKERADATVKLRERLDDLAGDDLTGAEKQRFDLVRRQERELSANAKSDEDSLQALRLAHARQRGQLEKDLAKAAAEQAKKNDATVNAHQLEFLPKEYQERARLMKQFEAEREALTAQNLGPDSPEMKRLVEWQRARVATLNADLSAPAYAASGGWASASAGRSMLMGMTAKEGDAAKLLNLTAEMKQTLVDIRTGIDQFSALS